MGICIKQLVNESKEIIEYLQKVSSAGVEQDCLFIASDSDWRKIRSAPDSRLAERSHPIVNRDGGPKKRRSESATSLCDAQLSRLCNPAIPESLLNPRKKAYTAISLRIELIEALIRITARSGITSQA
jgi:hypothetical protein